MSFGVYCTGIFNIHKSILERHYNQMYVYISELCNNKLNEKQLNCSKQSASKYPSSVSFVSAMQSYIFQKRQVCLNHKKQQLKSKTVTT